jgi:predicted alpha/beta superfamily hydrolase
MKTPKIALLALLLPLAAHATAIWRVPVHFAITDDAGMGNYWFVVGSHPDLGSWDRTKGVPLAWHEGNVWSADIALPAGAELEYKYVKQSSNASEFTDDTKAQWVPGENIHLTVPTDGIPPAPHKGKRIVFLCDWPEPVTCWFTTLSEPSYDATTDWYGVDMVKTGPGRYELDGIGEPGKWIRFSFNQPNEGWDYYFYGTTNHFWTPLDALCVRDGQIFDYEPIPAADGYVSDSQIVTTNVNSFDPDTIAGRNIRIYLPRGYNENTSRRYPVIYMTDGQQIFSDDPSASYGGWKADTAADYEIRAGRMREAIIVGIPCRDGSVPGLEKPIPGSARLWEYLPGTDCLLGAEQYPGLGTAYAHFVVDNVKPTLDWNFRTLSDRDNTAHVGSSAGGLFSFYVGYAYTNVFGLIGAISGVYTEDYIPNLRAQCATNHAAVAAPKRIWVDTGTEETDIQGQNLYGSNWDVLNLLLNAGHLQGKSFHFGVYTGDAGKHNEAAWAARIQDIYRFLLPVTDDFNPLLPRELSLSGNSIVLPVYANETPSLVRVPSLSSGVDPRTDSRAATVFAPTPSSDPWSTTNYTPSTSTTGFYFLRSTH